jgi:uncharacterized membrane-anchored protein
MAKKPAVKNEVNHYRRLVFGLGVLICVLLLFTLILGFPLLSATTVVLKTAPVDPLAPLRGQYIDIRYDISTIPAIEAAQSSQKVYVTLVEKQGIWRYASATLSKPGSGVFLRGTIQYIQGDTMDVRYGIEQYFFEKGGELPGRNLTVEAKVAGNGQARISQLLYLGKPLSITYQKPGIGS